MKRFLIRACSIAALILMSLGAGLTTANAGPIPAVTFDNATAPHILLNPPFTLGWQFTNTQAIDVTALGIFDSGQTGLIDSYPVGLWNASGTLLTSATVASGTVDPLTNQFRYAAITPLILAPGTYNIGALFITGDDPLFFANDAPGLRPTNFATSPLITFDQGVFGGGPMLQDPMGLNPGSPGYFGPNFLLTPVPEPGSMTLLGVGLFGLALLRRRKRMGRMWGIEAKAISLAILGLAVALSSAPASAAILYTNLPDLSANQTGDCVFNTTCSSAGAFGNTTTFGAEEFTLGSASTATTVDYNTTLQGSLVVGTTANWMILRANGGGGLPGTVVASGSGVLTATTGPVGVQSPTENYSFSIGSVALVGGTYYIAIQEVTSNFDDFWSEGLSGVSAETKDSGATWVFGYGGNPSLAIPNLAVTIEGTSAVPEPSSLALIAVGLAALGFCRRRAGAVVRTS